MSETNDSVLDSKEDKDKHLENIQESTTDEPTESEIPRSFKKWGELDFIPNKKRFIILSVVFSIIELAGLLIFAYAFLEDNPGGFPDFGLFVIPPFTGAALAYFVEQRKEGVAISAINGLSSIILFMISYVIFLKTVEDTTDLIMNFDLYFYALPIVFFLVQVAVTFAIVRIRKIYRTYGDSSIERESDKAMIEELKESRRKRGLEPVLEQEEQTEEPDIEAE